MKKIFALVLVFLASSLLLVTYLPISTAQNQDFKVLNYSWYTSPTTGYFVVVGELQNIGSKVYGNAIIRGLVYTVDGVEQATETYSLVCASILEPNDTAPFYMEYTGVTSVMGNLSWVDIGVDYIEFNIFGTETQSQKYTGVEIKAHTGFADQAGTYTVTAVLWNNGDLYPENVWIVGSFYDSSGTVIAIGYSNYLMPKYMAPDSTATINFSPKDPAVQVGQRIASYNIQVLTAGQILENPPETSPSQSISPTPSSSQSSSIEPTDNNGNAVSIPIDYIYIAIIAVAIAVVLILLLVVLKRRKT